MLATRKKSDVPRIPHDGRYEGDEIWDHSNENLFKRYHSRENNIAETEVRVHFVYGKEERQSKHNRILEERNSLGVFHKVTQRRIFCEW